ncbi:MAG: 1-acyl-sn-glycerol-3-phosphate acyltransferase [Actinomycetes bacterium]
MKRWVARRLWRLLGWRLVGEPPPADRVGVLVAAPHTSNWDYLLMLGVAWQAGIPTRFLGKRELFRWPLGVLMRATGGLPVDRNDPAGTVDTLVRRARAGDSFQLIVTPEGTRDRVEHWKSGFHRIARAAGVPVTMAFVDGPSRTAGFGPTFWPGDDIAADMDLLRDFYADKRGLRPANRTEPRLREEPGGRG